GCPPKPHTFNERYIVRSDWVAFCKEWGWVVWSPPDRCLYLLAMDDAPYSTPDQRRMSSNPSIIQAAIDYLFTEVDIDGEGQIVKMPRINGIPRYLPHKDSEGNITMTFCNIFVNDITRILNCEIPNNPALTNVHQMKCWLDNHSASEGWTAKSF